jgi:hypothetical protein
VEVRRAIGRHGIIPFIMESMVTFLTNLDMQQTACQLIAKLAQDGWSLGAWAFIHVCSF